MKLITKEKPHRIIAEKNKYIKLITDVYEPEHIDEETKELIPEHLPYYTTTIYVPDAFTEEMMNEQYIEEKIGK